jgi:hypothetical protein
VVDVDGLNVIDPPPGVVVIYPVPGIVPLFGTPNGNDGVGSSLTFDNTSFNASHCLGVILYSCTPWVNPCNQRTNSFDVIVSLLI